MAKHVAVLMGGWSAERDVSLSSGFACANAAEQEGFIVTRVDVDRHIAETLQNLKPDCALNVLHGTYGEDGRMQGLLEVIGIPYSHSGVLASALSINKPLAKEIMRDAGVPVAEGKMLSRFDAAGAHAMNEPYVIKPIDNGSSVGVHIIRDLNLPPPQSIASDEWKYGDTVLVEKYVAGRELTCAVRGEEVLGVIEILSDLPFYNYEAKYTQGESQHILPAEISSALYERVQEATKTAYRALGCRGIARADFRYNDATDELVCLEMNTQPGVTETSLVPELAAHAGYPFPKLVRWMIEDTSLNR